MTASIDRHLAETALVGYVQHPSTSAEGAALVLTVAEAADRLRISQWSVHKAIRERRLASIQIGSRRLIPVADLVAYVENLRQAARGAIYGE